MKNLRSPLTRHLRTFRDEEDGSVLVLSLFLLVTMLVLSGMSVDFMRFEAKRSVVQGCVDNAVLAAADLDKAGTKEEIQATTRDWFAAGDCIGVLDADPEVYPGENYRSVKASANLKLNTFFLKLIGMDTLTAGAVSAANEGIGNIEVSLVLDISGSMDQTIVDSDGNAVDFDRSTTGTQSRTRIQALRLAATSFVETLLTDEFKDRISISLVPYSGHVNMGETLFDAIKTNQRHGFSHCVDFPESELSKTTFDSSITYDQTEHFQWNSIWGTRSDGSYGPVISEPLCPRYDYEEIVPVSQNLTLLKGNIAQFRGRSATAIYMGLKWGIALLDPSMEATLDTLPSSMIDTVFRNRPVDYSINTGSGSTIKYLVLMTDGENDPHPRLAPALTDEPSEVAMWDEHHWFSYRDKYLRSVGGSYYNWSGVYTEEDDVDTLNTLMQTLCNNARSSGIIIYGIAMAATTTGQKQIEDCVASPARYFETEGGSLVEIFESIAGQITELRLTQ